MPQKSLLSVQNVCDILNVSRRTVYYWIKKDILKPIRIGSLYRFHPDDIDELIRDGRNESSNNQLRILVVDDDPLLRKCLETLLAREGFKVILASNGEEAIKLYKNQHFDLVIADIRMPGMNGVETLKALRELRQDKGKKATPEIVISGYHDENVNQQIQELGVRRFLQKPFEVQDLISTISQNLN